MIRLATHQDLGACLKMGALFFDESSFAEELEFDYESVEKTLWALIDGPDSVLFISEVGGKINGMAGALAYSHYFNSRAKTAQELFWWVDESVRGGSAGIRLLQALESWAKSLDCSTMTMICLPIDSPAEEIYKRVGYRPSERSYIKRL